MTTDHQTECYRLALEELEIELRVLIAMLRHEMGRWMPFDVKLQVEKLEMLMRMAPNAMAGVTEED